MWSAPTLITELLGRYPDLDGYDFWLNILNNAEPNNYRAMVCAFITSAEYQHRFGYDPSKEKLPLLINIPNLKLRGGTTLVRDDDGLPESVVPGPSTIVVADRPQGSKQYVVLISRTHPLEDPETEMARRQCNNHWVLAPGRSDPSAPGGVSWRGWSDGFRCTRVVNGGLLE